MASGKKNRGVLGVLALVFVLAGAYFALVVAPPDAYQGEVYRIIYLHIPSIVAAYLSFFIMFVGSCLFLFWKREKRDDILAYSAAEIGVLFTGLVIVEGMIWGKPTWGVWWTWDARLTLTAILFLIFVGYLMMRSLIDDENRSAVYGAVLGVIGFLDIPLIHMSVYWWRTLHQPPSILRPDKVTIDWSMRWVVLFNMIAFIILSLYLLSQRIRLAETEEEIKRLKLYGAA
ncbi:MAG: cytochrome c biogenesis protein CcsA [Candidatus Binatia bacterium]